MTRRLSVVALAITLVSSLLVLSPGRALAHESRDVAGGKYQFVVGFLVEPAYEGQKNGLDLRVRVPGTTPTPVTGLEKTLQVEITYVSTNQSVTKPIRAISASSDPGHYTTDLLPTQPGQYRFRIFGTVENSQVNEAFTSGDKFNNVDKAESLTFPDALPAVRSIQGAATDAQNTAVSADSKASSARSLAVVGIALGAAALGLSLGLLMKRRAA
jgi:hypothetical protein